MEEGLHGSWSKIFRGSIHSRIAPVLAWRLQKGYIYIYIYTRKEYDIFLCAVAL